MLKVSRDCNVIMHNNFKKSINYGFDNLKNKSFIIYVYIAITNALPTTYLKHAYEIWEI